MGPGPSLRGQHQQSLTMQSDDVPEARWTKEEGGDVWDAPKQGREDSRPCGGTKLDCRVKEGQRKGQGPKKDGHVKEGTAAASEGWMAGEVKSGDLNGEGQKKPVAAAKVHARTKESRHDSEVRRSGKGARANGGVKARLRGLPVRTIPPQLPPRCRSPLSHTSRPGWPKPRNQKMPALEQKPQLGRVHPIPSI